MPNTITFNVGEGGLGRPLTGEDFISGYIHYTTALPSGFGTASRIKEVFSVADAEALGITDTHLGEIRATASVTVTATGSTSDTLLISVNGTTLGTYTKPVTDTTVGLVSVGIATIVNAASASTGYYVTGATTANGVSTYVAPAGSGVGANGYTFSNVSTGTIASTNGTFSGGVASEIDNIHYHISEYFRAQPKGDLFVDIETQSADFAEITNLQNFATGKIRQVGVFSNNAFSTGDLTLLQTQATALFNNYKPLEVIYQPNFAAVSDLTTLTDLHTLSDKNVSVALGQDGGARGLALYKATGKSIGTVGILLGAVAFAAVNESIAWVGKFNMASTELDKLAFANGTLYTALSDGTINNIDGKGYIFLKKQIGINGSYFDNPYTAITVTSDYSRINNNRTMNKAIRNLRAFLLPELAGPINFNADGTLTDGIIGHFEQLGAQALDVMVQAFEVSAYSVIVNPVQNVLATGKLILTVAIIPVGTADIITVNIGFTRAL
jgi:hypothetical protein